jgi:hypothetical protein
MAVDMSDASQGDGWWMATDGKWYAPVKPASAPVPLPPPPAASNGFVLTIGDIGVTYDTVVTPNGNAELAGSQWLLIDRTTTENKIPTWAIVLTIVFTLLCLVGLLFLLVKETTVTGYVEVSVRSGNLVHMTQLPVRNQHDINNYRQLVSQAQTLAAQAAGRP